ncbi:Calpastatin, partial [Galemys pyrenaicus]
PWGRGWPMTLRELPMDYQIEEESVVHDDLSNPQQTKQTGHQGVEVSTSSPSTSKSSSMNSAETKAVKPEPEKKSQSSKPKSHSKNEPDTGSKHAHGEKPLPKSSEPPTSEKATKPKTRSQDKLSADKESIVAGVTAASDKADDKKKENKLLAASVDSKPDQPSGKSGMDAALDDLIDTLGEPEQTEQDNTKYTGPEISDPMTSTYIEELGKREVTIPPKYRELLEKPMGPDDAIDSLSSDFTCSSSTAGGEQAEKEKPTGEVLKAQSVSVIKSAAPHHEKKRRVEENAMSDQALEALSASLGSRKSEPELDLSSIKQVDEAKSKEEKLKKCGEDDETVPSEYRLKTVTDKDGKPLLPEPEEKSKPLSESELIDELSEDFNPSKRKKRQSKPTEKADEAQATTPTPVEEAVPRTSLCSIQSAPSKPAMTKGMVPDDAVEALAGSLGKREADPDDGKTVEDKVKEKSKEEDREKLGEKEETIPPDYRLEEIKDKDGKPLLPQKPKESLPVSTISLNLSSHLALSPMNDDLLLDALSKDFTSPTKISPLPSNSKALDDALDQLSDSLGQRQPDPDDNKPMEDKVKERTKAEHRDKLGERDDTIPPEYRHLLDNDENKPAKSPTKKPQSSKKPKDDQEAIDSLSGDFDSCPTTTESSEQTAKDKDKKNVSSSKAPKNGGKAKNSAKVNSSKYTTN